MIQIAITSHKSNYVKCAIPLVKSFLNSGIELNKISVFVGGFNNKSSNVDLCRIYKTDHNSYDHTAIIEIIENNLESDYWFILHDTCIADDNFKNYYKKHGYDLVTITKAGWWNMGLYSWDFIQRNKDYFISLKNCTKSQAILSERFSNRLTENLSYYVEEKDIIEKKPSDIYNDSVLRKGMYFKDLGLTKYQSYYPNSKLLKELSK
jgi:hypothetical protein